MMLSPSFSLVLTPCSWPIRVPLIVTANPVLTSFRPGSKTSFLKALP